MTKAFIVAAAVLLMLATAPALSAGIIVSLQAFDMPAAPAAPATPATRPAPGPATDRPAAPPADPVTLPLDPAATGTPVGTLEVLAEPKHPFHCCAIVAGRTLEVEGELHVSTDGYYRLAIDASSRSAGGSQQIKTSVMLKPDKLMAIGGLMPVGAKPITLMTVQLKTPHPK